MLQADFLRVAFDSKACQIKMGQGWEVAGSAARGRRDKCIGTKPAVW